MSGVDVLAVMIAAEEKIIFARGEWSDLREARAAVADLIERERIMREALDSIANYSRDITGGKQMVEIAAAALTRCGAK